MSKKKEKEKFISLEDYENRLKEEAEKPEEELTEDQKQAYYEEIRRAMESLEEEETTYAQNNIYREDCTELELNLLNIGLYELALEVRSIRGEWGPSNATPEDIKPACFRVEASTTCIKILGAITGMETTFANTKYLVNLTANINRLVEEQIELEDDADRTWPSLREYLDDIFIKNQEAKEALEKEEELIAKHRKDFTIWSLLNSEQVIIPEGCSIITKEDWINRYECTEIDYFRFSDGEEFQMEEGDDFLTYYKEQGYEVLPGTGSK